MAFIKLHGKGVDEGINILVNTAQIEYILADAGGIKFPDCDTFWAQETPEEILKRIQEVQNETNANK